MKGYFITATDTDAGKTFVTAGLLQGLSSQGYKTLGFKPVASGCQLKDGYLQNDDALQLINAASVSLDYAAINPYTFEPAIAPHIAAQQAGVTIDLSRIADIIEQHQHKADYVLVEGVGGWLVPLNEQEMVADLARRLNFPVIMVVNMRLGCINHALLTEYAIVQKGLTVAGWVANNSHADNAMDCMEENIQTLESHLDAPLLGVIPNLSASDRMNERCFSDFIDLEKCNP